MAEPLLTAVGLTKRFGETLALENVSLEIIPGEIHVLAGENGAGKTTLVNILSGLYRPDAGAIRFGGRRVEIRTPAGALALGIGMVHQHSELVLPFTALENTVLGREGGTPWLRPRRQEAEIAALAGRYGLTVPLEVPVRDLSVGERQKVEILKTLGRGIRILILDEPTTLLTPHEVDALFRTVRSITADARAVIFITHKLREALSLGDRITILRGGRRVAVLPRRAAGEADLVEMMFGGRIDPVRLERPATGGETALSVRGLTVMNDQGLPAILGGTFEVHSGEAVGIAGVAGNGQRELIDALIGGRRAAAGSITLLGQEVSRWPIERRLALGLAYIPEDRLREGILPSSSLAETLVLGLQPVRFRGRARYDPKAALALAADAIAEYRIAARDGTVPTATLSGGNIQKVLMARAMLQATAAGRAALVAANPARGLDIAATLAVHHRLLDLRASGRALLLVSEDLDELMELCDRILILHRGRLVGEVPRGRFDAYEMGALMIGARAGRP